MTTFDTASSSDFVVWEELNGSLLIVDPLEHVQNIPTTQGTTDAVRAVVSVVDSPNPELVDKVYDDALVFPKVLKARLKSKIGRKVLGRLGQGEAKGGNNPPWILFNPGDADTAKAQAWVDAHQPTFATADADDTDTGVF